MKPGLSAKLIAAADQRRSYADGRELEENYHEMMDGAAVVPLAGGGYVYVTVAGGGGVYGLYFDACGDVYEYKALLEDMTGNCGGGLTPWNTWISCEEYDDGQCWQVSYSVGCCHCCILSCTFLYNLTLSFDCTLYV